MCRQGESHRGGVAMGAPCAACECCQLGFGFAHTHTHTYTESPRQPLSHTHHCSLILGTTVHCALCVCLQRKQPPLATHRLSSRLPRFLSELVQRQICSGAVSFVQQKRSSSSSSITWQHHTQTCIHTDYCRCYTEAAGEARCTLWAASVFRDRRQRDKGC